MVGQFSHRAIVKLILRIASCVISVCSAVIIFAVSLPFYAEGLAEWGDGDPYKATLLLGLFVSASAIGIVAIQTNVERSTKKVLVIGGVVGGMGSLTLALFTAASFNPVIRLLNPSNAFEAIFFALATLITVLRTSYVLRIALRPQIASPRTVS